MPFKITLSFSFFATFFSRLFFATFFATFFRDFFRAFFSHNILSPQAQKRTTRAKWLRLRRLRCYLQQQPRKML